MIKLGNIYYFGFIFIAIILTYLLYLFLKNKTKDYIKLFLQIVLFANLGLHFCKLLFSPYFELLPNSIRKVTFENICAVSTLLFPFISLIKKEDSILKNYMYFIGILGGGLAILYPTEAFNKSPFTFDTIRFYICHYILFIVPLFSVLFGLIKLDYKKSIWIPICFIIIEIIILINEIILIKIGFVECDNIAMFLDRDYRNSSFIFGPLSSFDNISKIITVFTPNVFKVDYFNINNGIDFYFPVLWLIIPAFIYLPIVNIIIGLPFNNIRRVKIGDKND